jgi:SAM-dependent methyltransferase
MSQNIYDRPDFFKAYSENIDRSDADLEDDLAWSRLRKLLPDVKGLDIIDLGCGSGWFCRWAVDQGAKSVLGIDLSQNMLDKADWLSKDNESYGTKIKYQRADLDSLELSDEHTGRYDLAFSSLALHYLANLDKLMSLIHGVLKPGAPFVCNVEHPIYTAPHVPRALLIPETDGQKCWALTDYYKEGERVIDWLAPGLRKQHRTVTAYLECFFRTGFELTSFVEFLPTEEEVLSGKVVEIETLRPLFLFMSLRRRN